MFPYMSSARNSWGVDDVPLLSELSEELSQWGLIQGWFKISGIVNQSSGCY